MLGGVNLAEAVSLRQAARYEIEIDNLASPAGYAQASQGRSKIGEVTLRASFDMEQPPRSCQTEQFP